MRTFTDVSWSVDDTTLATTIVRRLAALTQADPDSRDAGQAFRNISQVSVHDAETVMVAMNNNRPVTVSVENGKVSFLVL